MNINVHNTKVIEMGPVLPVNDHFYRRIIVQTDKGEELDLVLFSNNAEDLWIKS